MKLSTAIIATLVASNIGLGVLALHLARKPTSIPVEHVRRVHMDVDGGNVMRVTLEHHGERAELVLTPRATVELSSGLNRMLHIVKRVTTKPKPDDEVL